MFFLQFQTILLPYKLCVTKKKTILNKFKFPHVLPVLLSIPLNYIPCWIGLGSALKQQSSCIIIVCRIAEEWCWYVYHKVHKMVEFQIGHSKIQDWKALPSHRMCGNVTKLIVWDYYSHISTEVGSSSLIIYHSS